jgi:hypothetical protein
LRQLIEIVVLQILGWLEYLTKLVQIRRRANFSRSGYLMVMWMRDWNAGSMASMLGSAKDFVELNGMNMAHTSRFRVSRCAKTYH